MTTRTESTLWRLGAYLLIASMAVFMVSVSQAQAAPQAVISFNKPTKYTDGTTIAANAVITYELFQGLKGAAKAKVSTITTTTATVTSGLVAGNEYCWQVTAIINAVTSALSNEGCKAFPFPTPEAVVITVQ